MTSPLGDELRLRRQFGELRERERRHAPTYGDVMVRARERAARPPRRAGWQRGVVAAAAVIVALSLFVVRRHVQRERGTFSAPSAASSLDASLPSWASPTASLLSTPGSNRLRTLPDLRASLVDRAIPSIRTEDSGS
jgi:hypothetical protein